MSTILKSNAQKKTARDIAEKRERLLRSRARPVEMMKPGLASSGLDEEVITKARRVLAHFEETISGVNALARKVRLTTTQATTRQCAKRMTFTIYKLE